MFQNNDNLELYIDAIKNENLIDSLPEYITIHCIEILIPIGEIACSYEVSYISKNIPILAFIY